MNIRQLIRNDFLELYSFWKEVGLWLYPLGEEQEKYEGILGLHPHFVLGLINKDNRLVGSIIGAYDGRTLSVHRLAVHPRIQRKGYGKKLLNALEDLAKKHKIRKISLQVHFANKQVIEFYKKQGYVQDKVVVLKRNLF